MCSIPGPEIAASITRWTGSRVPARKAMRRLRNSRGRSRSAIIEAVLVDHFWIAMDRVAQPPPAVQNVNRLDDRGPQAPGSPKRAGFVRAGVEMPRLRNYRSNRLNGKM